MDVEEKMPNKDTEASQYMQATAHMMSKASEFREIFKATKHCSPFLSQQNVYDR
jgi:hypothetical protein